MDYKEKLKAIINSNKTPFVDINTFLKYFPELNESEDERIRKLLVEAVTQVLQDQYCSNRGVSKEKVVAWLEKQGKQKTTEWSEEDEYTIQVLMNIIKESEIIDSFIYTDSLKEKLYNWVKELKNRI